MERHKVVLANVVIDNVTTEDVLVQIGDYVGKRIGFGTIVTPNIDHIVKLQKDVEFRKVYDDAVLVLADGMPLLWAARFLGTPLKEKISGSDLFPEVCKVAAQKGYRIFLMGGRPGAADAARDRLLQKFPSLQVVGTCCPPFGFEKDIQENRKIIAMIREARPDILFVGLGAPKQEKWISAYKDQYQVAVSIGVGVTFEFVAGMVKRAPIWMQKGGLEWLWRLFQEPGRLWRRYLIDDPIFFWLVIKQKFNMK